MSIVDENIINIKGCLCIPIKSTGDVSIPEYDNTVILYCDGDTSGIKYKNNLGKVSLSSVFGSEFKNISNNGESETNNKNSYDTSLTLTTDDLPSGTYKISWYYNWYCDDTKTEINVKIDVDDTDIIHTHVERNSKRQTTYPIESGFIDIQLTTGVKNIKLKFKSSTSKDVLLSNKRLEIFRII